jgi:hypothetical protein
MERDGMLLQRELFQKGVRYTIVGLPMVVIVGSSFFPLLPITRQLMILASLIWLQVTFLIYIFSPS